MLQKTLSIMKELFAECGIPESLCTDNDPQFDTALFAEFAIEWKFDHNTSTPRNPRSNGQAEVALKIVKRFLMFAKCSGQDLYLTLLVYHNLPTDAHLHSLVELLYQ